MDTISTKDVPVHELALLYLNHHHEGLNTPADYVDAFNKIRQAMKEHLKKDIPDTVAPPKFSTSPSPWKI